MNQKQRLETFSDGVMAIIITIMVLNIKVPASTDFAEILNFLNSIFVFFISFIIVGNFWNLHRYLFEKIESINKKLLWRNMLFLFFLSLIPLFTNWVTQYPNSAVPVWGYGLVSLCVYLCYSAMFQSALSLLKKGTDLNIRGRGRHKDIPFQKQLVIRTIAQTLLILLVTLVSFFSPRISALLLIGFPVVSSLMNAWFERDRKRGAGSNNQPDIS